MVRPFDNFGLNELWFCPAETLTAYRADAEEFCARVDRIDGGMALGVLAPGSHRRHGHAGGDLIGDPGLSDELAAVVEHADVRAVGDTALRCVMRVHSHRLLALHAALRGLVDGVSITSAAVRNTTSTAPG
jgi:hypothetical protein